MKKNKPLSHVTRAAALTLLLMMMLVIPRRASGQEQLVVADPAAESSFGREIVFTARLSPVESIQQVSIFFHGAQENSTRAEPVAMEPDGSIRYAFDASQNTFAPFSWIEYWVQVTLRDGQVLTSETFRFQYRDDRFDWRELSRSGVTVHWYGGDEAFGAAALDAAAIGLASIQNLVTQPESAHVEIYIYASPADLQTVLPPGTAEWVGGQADPAQGVVLTAVAPGEGQALGLQTRIPHELAHVILYRSLGAGYDLQPRWLVEGLASITEQYPSPDYARAIEVAARDGSLYAMQDLCDAFPAQEEQAYLAYAQSQSFTAYLKEVHGAPGLKRLMEQYSAGATCDAGAANALGAPLAELELRWRAGILDQNSGGALLNLLPYALLLGLVLLVPLWGFLDPFRKGRRP